MLALRGVRYRYAGFATPVLHDIDLELADGEIVGLVGPNEAGKSTLCLVAAGLAPGSIRGELTGSVTIDGLDMAGQPLHAFSTRVGIGFQNPATQLSGITGSVFEEVALGPMNLGLPARETVERARWALATLRIEALAEREPRRLSGGQGQLVVLASLLAMRPGHLVLDEPTAQLDPEGSRLVGEALRELAATGTALLVSLLLLALLPTFAWNHPRRIIRTLARLTVMLALAVLVEMWMQIFGDGQRDLIKHLYLANVCFDGALVSALGLAVTVTFERKTERGERIGDRGEVEANGQKPTAKVVQRNDRTQRHEP